MYQKTDRYALAYALSLGLTFALLSVAVSFAVRWAQRRPTPAPQGVVEGVAEGVRVEVEGSVFLGTVESTPPELSVCTYAATVRDVHDGDTLSAVLDLGVGVHLDQKVRLISGTSGVNTPELWGDTKEAGLRSRDRVRVLCEGVPVVLRTRKDKRDKYGRLLAEVWVASSDGVLVDVGALLLREGLAQPYIP